MAAVTPTTIKRINMGSVDAYICSFAATTDDADTWDSNISNIVHVIATQADTAGTQGSTGAGASFSGDTVTFHIGEDNSAIELLVLAGTAH